MRISPPGFPMERFRGRINSFSMNSEWYDDDLIPHQTHHAMPFLQMLQGAMQAEETEEEDQLHLQTSRGPVEQHECCITHASDPQSNSRVAGHKRSSCNDEEKKRRKRPRAAASLKKAEEMESQRLTHIAVERNRRQVMNDHLAALRALTPPSFVRRGDQASIIGGAIEFVKELEQHLLSLQSQKQRRTAATATSSSSASNEEDACAASTTTTTIHGGFFVSPQYTTYSRFLSGETKEGDGGSAGVDVETTVVQEHVNLKVAGRRQAGQLVRAIAALEELRLSVLHLNVATLGDSSIFYCLNLRMEHECKLASADEIATAVHQIFTYVNTY